MSVTATRRRVLTALGAGAAAAALPAAATAAPVMRVVKDPNCGCCDAWVDILRRDGFDVAVEPRDAAALAAHKVAVGVPPELASCHTATIDGYVVEGHVPPADIRRLLAERPDALGLTVPGMPYGSPGMGPASEREAYDVVLVRRAGPPEVFASYAAA